MPTHSWAVCFIIMNIDNRKVAKAFQKLSKHNQNVIWEFISDHADEPDKTGVKLNDVILESAKIKDSEKQCVYLVSELLKLY